MNARREWDGWRIETIDRPDQRGFWLRRNGRAKVALHWWRIYRHAKPWPLGALFELTWGPGAGYIGGATAYVGLRARGGVPGKPHGPWPLVRAGVTRDANRVPFAFGAP